jgi:hypothetical protein
VRIHYPDCFDSVKRFLDATLKSLNLPPTTTRTKASPLDLKLLSQKVLWEDIRIGMQEIRINGHKWTNIKKVPYGVEKITICAYYAIVKVETFEGMFCLDYDQIMMISDSDISCLLFDLQ